MSYAAMPKSTNSVYSAANDPICVSSSGTWKIDVAFPVKMGILNARLSQKGIYPVSRSTGKNVEWSLPQTSLYIQSTDKVRLVKKFRARIT